MELIQQPRTIEELDKAIESTALKRVIVRQGEGDLFLCGQCCVAMFANVTLQEAIIACGQTGATEKQDIIDGLWILQIESAWSVWNAAHIPDICIIRTVRNDTSHWVLRVADTLFDPSQPDPVPFVADGLKHPRTVIRRVVHE